MSHMDFPEAISLILILSTLLYGSTAVGLVIGLLRLGPRRSPLQAQFVSVIVAARNEEASVGMLLETLALQDYPNCEVIVVNDRSSDRTGEVVRSFQHRMKNLRCIDIREIGSNLPAKKNALTTGILASRGEILCFTDADCAPPPKWISLLVEGFEPEVGFVVGYSPYESRPSYDLAISVKLLQGFIRYEEFRGALWSAGAVGIGLGWLCTGRNLAYRRSVWDEVRGFEQIKSSISGDDDLFLQVVRRMTSWKIHYLTHPASFVPTPPPVTLSDFIQQRRRHFSAGKYFSLPMQTFFVLFHLSNLFIFLGLVSWICTGATPGFFAFIGKVLFDILLYVTGAWKLRQWRFAPTFLFMEMLYILYNTLVGPLGFFGTFEWKPQTKS